MATKLLSNKRRYYVEQRKPQFVKGLPLRVNVGVQQRYQKDLDRLMSQIIAETEKTVRNIFKSEASKEFFAQDESIASIARINLNKLSRRIAELLNKKAKAMAERMVNNTSKASASSLHQSLKEMSGGLSIKTSITSGVVAESFKASVAANVDLIKTIPDVYLNNVKGAVSRSIQNGGGLQTLIPEIEKLLSNEAKKIKNKAKNVALDQTRKAYNSLNAARMSSIGIDEFEWIHSGGGQRPREYHKENWPAGLNHGIFSLKNLPIVNKKTGARGLPGNQPNCKCTMRPIIKFNEGEPVDG